MDENHTFTLPGEPWTYGNGSLNPDLHPGSSTSRLRGRGSLLTSRQHRHTYPDGEMDGTYAQQVPPHHADYDESQPSYEHYSQPPYADEDEEEDEDGSRRGQFIRRGSEGYEVRPIDREEMMRHYLGSQSHLAGFELETEDDNHNVNDEEGEEEGGERVWNDEEMAREVRKRVGKAGRYRPYLPERCESEDEDEDEAEQTPDGFPVQS